MSEAVLRSARGDELDASTLYSLLRLRGEVFVVEQGSPYLDPDGHDLEPGTIHVWADIDGTPVACVRIIRDPDGAARIGRVATAAGRRGSGLAARLLGRALDAIGDEPVVLNAQTYLEGWYRSLGFARTGLPFDEDGIPHVPMGRG